MDTTDAFTGLVCRDCDTPHSPTTDSNSCPSCGGILESAYELNSVDSDAVFAGLGGDSMWTYDEVLPFEASTAVSLAAGGTPTIDCPKIATELDLDQLRVKDEGRNPTGSIRDRECAVAVTAAAVSGAETVALPSTGAAGQTTAAYAARADLDANVFLPSRAAFDTKAMVNVHGGEMTVVEGRYPDAVAEFDTSLEDAWYSLAPFDSAFRVEGTKTVMYELADALEDRSDAIVVPTSHGTILYGMMMATRELLDLGLLESMPDFYVAQPSGCAPIVNAIERGTPEPKPIEAPDTICGALEVPDPAGGEVLLDSLEEIGGGVAVDDDEALEAAVAIEGTAGLEANVACGVAAAGAAMLRENGSIAADDTVTLLNPGLGSGDADVLRSHLMRHGI